MDSATPTSQFSFCSRTLFRALFVIIAVLVIASTAGQISRYVFDHGNLFGLVRLFYLDEEQSIPAYFSSLQLLLAAVLLCGVALLKRAQLDRDARQWAVLALGFVFLSIDENCSIHEFFGDRMPGLKATGFFYFAWVIPGAIITVAAGLFFLPFIVRLPSDTRRDFIIGALLFLGGALGTEMLGGRYAEVHGYRNLGYVAFATTEETLEMVGIAVFVRALLRYIERTHGAFVMVLGQPQARRPAPPAAEAVFAVVRSSDR
jgi:hypothetical protein